MTAFPTLQINPSAPISQETRDMLALPSVMWPDGAPTAKKVDSLGSLPAETDEVTPFKRLLAGKVGQFSRAVSGWQQSVEEKRDKASQSSAQLQRLLDKAQPKKDFQELKTSVSESTLSSFTPFSERKATMIRCLQGTEKSSSKCMAAFISRTPEEQQEAIDVVTKAPIGKVVDAIAAPFAAISTAATTAVKAAVKVTAESLIDSFCHTGSIKNPGKCATTLRSALGGKDPKFNETVKLATPKWVFQAGKAVAAVDRAFENVDEYMSQTYYTTRHLIHEGIRGLTDVVILPAGGFAVGASFRFVKSTVMEGGMSALAMTKNISKIPTPGLGLVVESQAPSVIIPTSYVMDRTAHRVTQASEGCLSFFSPTKLEELSLKDIHRIWDINHKTMVGIEASENIPHFGFHGTGKKGLAGILESKKSISHYEPDKLFIASTRYPSLTDPITMLADRYTILRKAAQYEKPGGGMLIFDASTAVSYRLPIGIGLNRPKILEVDNAAQRAFLGLVGRHKGDDALLLGTNLQKKMISTTEIFNADEFLLHVNPENFGSLYKGVIKVEETLYNPINRYAFGYSDFESMLYRLKEQERLIKTYMELGVVDLEAAPWSKYHAVGSEYMDYLREVTQMPRELYYQMEKEFMSRNARNIRTKVQRTSITSLPSIPEKNPFTKFIKDEGGYGKSPFAALSRSEKQKPHHERYVEVMEQDRALQETMQLPLIESLPPACPKHLVHFLSKAEPKSISGSKLGEKKIGRLNAKILHVTFKAEEGTSALYLLQRKLPLSSIQAQYLTTTERLDFIIKDLFEHSRALGHQRVFLAFAEGTPVTTALVNRSEKIIAKGSFSKGKLEKPMNLLEVDISS